MKRIFSIIKFFIKGVLRQNLILRQILRRVFSVIKFFITKHWKDVMVLVLVLLMFTLGFTVAWQIQGRKDNVRALEQDRLISYLLNEQLRNNKVFRDVAIMLMDWEEKIEKLQREREKIEKEEEKQRKYNELLGEYKEE